MFNIVATLNKAIVVNKMSIEKKYFDFIDHFSECNPLKLIPNSTITNMRSGIVINSNSAPKKIFRKICL